MIEYLKEFGECFKFKIIELISRNLRQDELVNKDACDKEILHHSIMCNKLTKQMIIRPELVSRVSQIV